MSESNAFLNAWERDSAPLPGDVVEAAGTISALLSPNPESSSGL